MSRIAVCALLFVASGLLVCQHAGPVGAQDRKEKIAVLEKQLRAAQQVINQVEKQNVSLRNEIATLKNNNAKLKSENNRLQGIIKKDKDAKTIKDLQTTIDGYRLAGLVHVVILKLKSDSSSSEPQSLIDDAYSQLTKIKPVRGLWAGKPAAKGTPDANSDYTVALVLLFDDADGLKSYLGDSAHTKFADKHLKKWETPVVYDFEPKKPAP